MRGAAHIGVWSFLALLLAPAATNAGGIPAKTLKELKAASVYIKVEFTPADGKGKSVPVTGSGFLLHVAGRYAYIATNSHVVTPLGGEVPRGNPRIVFHSGTANEKIVEAQIVARDPIRDLAILKIAAFKDLPRPISADPNIEVGETMTVYAVGFPFGADLGLGKTNPALTITKGTISSLRNDERGQVKLIQIDAEINPGNSGGPVVNEKGQLVGVAVSKLIKAKSIGFAIPLKPVAELMQGKVGAVTFDTLWVVKGQGEISVNATLIDPLGKLKDAALYYRLAPLDGGSELPRPDKDGKVAPLKDASQVWFKMSSVRGEARFTLKAKGEGKQVIAYQTSYVTAAGKTVFSPVNLATLDFTQVLYSENLTANDPVNARGKPLKVFTHPMKAGKHYVIDMRANPKDLDPHVIVQDAAGTVLAEDDGTDGLFDALLVFSPPKDGDYEIVASALKGMGPFTLRIREDTGTQLGPKGLDLAGALTASDISDTTPQQSFNLILKKGKSYAIDAKSKEFDPFLRLENMGKVILKNEDLGGGGHSTLYFSPFHDGIYRVTATAFDARVGRFEMTVRETPGLKQHEVGKDGLKLAGKLDVLDPLDIVNGKVSKGRCKVFTVKMKGGQGYQIDLTSNQFDAYLRI